ncbi:MAG: hypothetical protein ACRC7D_15020 [Aeromonas popoffii]
MQLNLPRLILRWINESRGNMSIQSFIIKKITESKDFRDYEEKYGKQERK